MRVYSTTLQTQLNNRQKTAKPYLIEWFVCLGQPVASHSCGSILQMVFFPTGEKKEWFLISHCIYLLFLLDSKSFSLGGCADWTWLGSTRATLGKETSRPSPCVHQLAGGCRSALQAEQVVDVAHCSWLDLVVMPIFAATLADQHLLHTAPQLLMVREETTVQDVHLVALLHLHPDPALVGCQCILFGHQNIPVLVLHAQLEEKPGAEHAKTGFTLQNGALRFDYYLAPSVPPPKKK